MDVRVSIIIPSYNTSAYIVRCLDSVAAQTFSGLECIIVDDASSDGTPEKIRRFIADYTGPVAFRLVAHDTNTGVSAVRNAGTKLATGEFIYYMDSDDQITPDCIRSLVALADRYPGVDFVQSNARVLPAGHTQYWAKKGGITEYVEGNENIRKLFSRTDGQFPPFCWGKLVARRYVDKYGLDFLEGIIHSDQLWTFHLVEHAEKMAVTLEPSYLYHVVPGSITTGSPNARKYDAWRVLTEKIFASATPVPDFQRKYFYKRFSRVVLSSDITGMEPRVLQDWIALIEGQLIPAARQRGCRGEVRALKFMLFLRRHNMTWMRVLYSHIMRRMF